MVPNSVVYGMIAFTSLNVILFHPLFRLATESAGFGINTDAFLFYLGVFVVALFTSLVQIGIAGALFEAIHAHNMFARPGSFDEVLPLPIAIATHLNVFLLSSIEVYFEWSSNFLGIPRPIWAVFVMLPLSITMSVIELEIVLRVYRWFKGR